jgi:hypothetical protein
MEVWREKRANKAPPNQSLEPTRLSRALLRCESPLQRFVCVWPRCGSRLAAQLQSDEPKLRCVSFRLIGCGWRRLLDLNAEGGLARDPAHGTSAITRLAPPNCALRCAQSATSPTAPVRRHFYRHPLASMLLRFRIGGNDERVTA